MFERMLDKGTLPNVCEIEKYIGKRAYEELSDEGKELWKNRYPYGDGGGWIHYRLLSDENFLDAGKLIMMKVDKEIPWELHSGTGREK